MKDQERPLLDRIWEFTKDISVKVSRQAEKHWKINTLRVEIASIKHRVHVKYKELGRYVYESVKSQTLEEESYKATLREFFDELKSLEGQIQEREHRIGVLEREMAAQREEEMPETVDHVPPAPSETMAGAGTAEEADAPPLPEEDVAVEDGEDSGDAEDTLQEEKAEIPPPPKEPAAKKTRKTATARSAAKKKSSD